MPIGSHLSRVLFLLIAVVLSFSAEEVVAQKKKKSSREERKVREATFYFTEGVKYYILSEPDFDSENMDRALMLFKKSLESDADNATAYFKIATILAGRGDLDNALSNANKAMELDPENPYFYTLTADILTRKSNFAEAAQIYERLIANLDDTDEYLFDLAAIYLYQGDYEQGLEVYNQAEKVFGVNPEVTRAKQQIYLKLNKLDKAIEEGEKLVQTYPGEVSYVMALAEIFVSNDREKDAIPYLEGLLEVSPNNPEARLMLSKIYQQTGSGEQATESMEVAFANPDLSLKLKLDLIAKHIRELPNADTEIMLHALTDLLIETHPEEADAYVIKGDFLNAIKDSEGARDNYLKSLEYEDTNFNVWQNLLTIEFQDLQDTESVIEHSESALELFPNQAVIYFYNGAANSVAKNYDEAAYALEQSKRLANNDELAKYSNMYLGDVYNEMKDYKKSEQAYETVLKLDPTNDYVLNNYSYFLALRQEKLDYADKLSTRLLELNPENANYLDTRAWVLYKRGEFKQARKLLEKAIENNDESGVIVEHYGDVLFKLGEVDQAVKQWMKAKGMDDTSELIDKKIADRKLYE
ncbi:tetratricopeptide (TPR) repeat protein [Catalinimonas alkaloidigena]|uniref:tetratricopeptide repeat protein n=1 Tax=Catalinimonas alkaloidigena TaxID=1075417 RepID=UPI002404CF1C|nr:tetratricopeptide repeat protein [Catalinimonas alkaloidigena]MDF9795143.1 tetratricopeptide (TPR) repeat protein [Catalinimonas alkaloidigena]